MAVFLSDLVFMFELFAIAGGLVLIDRAAVSAGGYTKLAGWLLVVGGIGTALCTGYYWLKYNGQGDFDRAYPPHMMQDMQGMGMKGGMMGPGTMGQQGASPGDCPRNRMMNQQDDAKGMQQGGMKMNDGQMRMGPGDGMDSGQQSMQRRRMMQNDTDQE